MCVCVCVCVCVSLGHSQAVACERPANALNRPVTKTHTLRDTSPAVKHTHTRAGTSHISRVTSAIRTNAFLSLLT